MKQKRTNKLRLTKATVDNLSDAEMAKNMGGLVSDNTLCDICPSQVINTQCNCPSVHDKSFCFCW